MSTTLKLKRGNKTTYDALMANELLRLDPGEPFFSLDTKELFISDGTTGQLIGKVEIGPLNNRPSPGVLGRAYFVSSGDQSGTLYIDDGTTQHGIVSGGSSGGGDQTTVPVSVGPYQVLGETDFVVNYVRAFDFQIDERTTQYHYSPLGDLTSAQILSDGTVLQDITYIYDSSNNLTQTIAIVNDVTCTTNYQYDVNDDLTSITKHVDGTQTVPDSELIATFIDLNDTPTTYTNNAGKVLVVSQDETGITFIDQTEISTPIRFLDITSATTVQGNDVCFVNSTNGSFNITLEPNPVFGTKIEFINGADSFESNPVTILRNGKKIMGLEEDLLQNTNTSFNLYYYNDEHGQRLA